MKQKKTKLILILLIVAAGVCGWLYQRSNVPAHEPGSGMTQEHDVETEEDTLETEQTAEQVISDELLIAVVDDTIGKDIAISGTTVEIREDGEISFTGTITKKDAAKLLEQQNSSMAGAYSSVLKLFPNELPLEIRIRLEAENGQIAIIPLGFTAASLELPDSMLPEDCFDSVESRLNEELRKQLKQVDALTVRDGNLIATGIK